MRIANNSNMNKEDYDEEVAELAIHAAEMADDQGRDLSECIWEAVDGSQLVIYSSGVDVVHEYSDADDAGELWQESTTFDDAKQAAAFDMLRQDVLDALRRLAVGLPMTV